MATTLRPTKSAFLLCKNKPVGDVIRACSLPLIIVSAVLSSTINTWFVKGTNALQRD